MSFPVRFLVMTSAVLLPACRSGASATGVAIRDSAGITLVENHAPSAAVYRTVEPAPALDLGAGDDPHTEFNRVVGPVVLADGRLVAGDGATQELRVFRPDGVWLRAIGRKGGGPGEFARLSVLQALPGDTLLVVDGATRRVSLFTPDGVLVREVTPAAPGGPRVIGRRPDGRLIARLGSATPPTMANGVLRDSVSLGWLGDDGAGWETITRAPGNEVLMRVAQGPGGQIASVNIVQLPFARTLWTALWGDRLVLGTTDAWQLAVHDRSGRLERLIRVSRSAEPVTAETLDRVVAAQVAQLTNATDAARAQVEASLREAPAPATLPAHGPILTSQDGTLWVAAYRFHGDPRPDIWSVFDPEGRWLGDVAMPARYELRAVHGDILAGVWRDADDVEHLRTYRLR